MRSLRLLGVPGVGPEDVLVSPDGSRVLTGTNDGSIWSLTIDGSRIERIAQTRTADCSSATLMRACSRSISCLAG